jgi:hypothetical protein
MSAQGPGRVKTQVVIASVEYFGRIAPHEKSNHVENITAGTLLENYIFYISRMYEFSHSLGHKQRI